VTLLSAAAAPALAVAAIEAAKNSRLLDILVSPFVWFATPV
jgi:hypothetical protein